MASPQPGEPKGVTETPQTDPHPSPGTEEPPPAPAAPTVESGQGGKSANSDRRVSGQVIQGETKAGKFTESGKDPGWHICNL